MIFGDVCKIEILEISVLMIKSIFKVEYIGKFLDKRIFFELVFNGYKLLGKGFLIICF